MSEQEKTELDLLREENERLRAKLKSFEKGTKREVFDINAVSAHKELLGGLYTIQRYDPVEIVIFFNILERLSGTLYFLTKRLKKKDCIEGRK